MAETDEEKKKREADERKAATLAALKKRGQDQIDDSMIKTGEEVRNAPIAGQSSTSIESRPVKTGYKDKDTVGAEQARALKTKPKTPADMTDAELAEAKKSGDLAAAAEANRRKTGGGKK